MMTLHLGDCLDVLHTLPADSVDAVVTDPPAGIGFMGKEWDAFGGRCNGNATADRDASYDRYGKGALPYGFSGSALPKRGERAAFITFLTPALAECLRVARPGAVALVWALPRTSHWTGTAIEDAGWVIEDRIAHLFGTGFPKHSSKLKPACEDWWLCRKPGPKWLGVEECRIPTAPADAAAMARCNTPGSGRLHPRERMYSGPANGSGPLDVTAGRWPAHVTLDDEAAALLDAQSGELHGAGFAQGPQEKWSYECGKNCYGKGDIKAAGARIGDTGGASRFFYVAKASRDDRGKGNAHPTVKSTALMRWLVRLACPDGGTVLDCFMGSGSTGVAAILEGRRFVGIERDPGYYAIAEQRIRQAAEADRQSLFPLADAPPTPASPPDLFD